MNVPAGSTDATRGASSLASATAHGAAPPTPGARAVARSSRSGLPGPAPPRRLDRFEPGILGLLVLVSGFTRLINLDRYSGSYPEGVRAEQLLLMQLGFRPFKDIFSDQGPWLLDVLYPGVALFGPNLIGVRAVVVLASIAGLAAAWWLLRGLAGRVAGIAALALLVASPTYLKFSRVAVAELVALAPALLSLGAALRFRDSGSRGWLFLAGLACGVSLLIKPIAVGVVLAVLLAVLQRRDRLSSVVLLGATTGGTVLVGMLLVGLPEIVSQILVFRAQSRQVEPWSLAGNLIRAREDLAEQGLAFYLLGGAGLLVACRRQHTWPLAVWALASVATVAVHGPLHAKHFTIVAVPSALLAGVALGTLAPLWRARGKGGAPDIVAGLVTALLLVLYVVELPKLLGRDAWILSSTDLFERDASIHWYADATSTLLRTTSAGSFVVTDHAYLAFAAGRPVPPGLAEASAVRVRAGSLSDEQAIDQTRRFEAQAVLLWADKLVDLRRYRAWLQSEYQLVRVWATEQDTRPELWLPRDSHLSASRAALRANLAPGPPEPLDGRLRAVAWGVHEPEYLAGAVVGVTIEWEAEQPVPGDELIELSLRDRDGRVVEEEREPLLGGRALLESGWWLSWVGGVRTPAALAPGDYGVVVRLRDRVNRRLGPEVQVGTIRIVAADG